MYYQSKSARVCQTAAAELSRPDSWCQETWEKSNGAQRCLVRTLADVLGNPREGHRLPKSFTKPVRRVLLASTRYPTITAKLNNMSLDDTLIHFNDIGRRTKSEVVRLLTWLATELELDYARQQLKRNGCEALTTEEPEFATLIEEPDSAKLKELVLV